MSWVGSLLFLSVFPGQFIEVLCCVELSFGGTDDLARLFSVFGNVRSANVVYNKIDHTSRCFGFVHFRQPRCVCVCVCVCVCERERESCGVLRLGEKKFPPTPGVLA